MRRVVLSFVLALLAVLAAACWPAVALGASGWVAPANLAEEAEKVSYGPFVAMDAGGDALAAWGGAGGNEAFRQAGGSWQTPGDLDVDGEPAGEPCVAMNEGGKTVALWVTTNAQHKMVIQAAAGSVAGGWGAPATLLEDPESALAFRGCHVAINASGEAVAVWSIEETFEFDVIYASWRSAGGEWQAPVLLRGASEPSGECDVAIDAAGDAEAVWDGRGLGIEGEYKPAGAGWQEPDSQTGAEHLSEQHVGLDPEVAFDANGEAIATWGIEGKESEGVVQASDRPAGGAWQTPVDLSEAGQDIYLPQQLAVDAAGEGLALWGLDEDGKHTIQAARLTAGGGWQPTVELSGAGEEALYPELAMSAQGAAVAVWEGQDAEGFSVRGAVRSAGREWQAPVAVSRTVSEGELFPQVAIDSHGDAIAGWELDNGSGYQIQAAGYQATGAQLENVAFPSTATVGQPVAFSASLFDVWAPLASMDWSFGDGASASGVDVTHTYSAPGVYPVTVTSEDALGNTSSATGATTVTTTTTTSTTTSSTTTSSTVTTSSVTTASHSMSKPAPIPSGFTILRLRAKPDGTITARISTSTAGRLSVCATMPAAKNAHVAAHRACHARVAGGSSLYGARSLHARSGTRTIMVQPGRAARAALRRHHKLHVRVTITFAPANGSPHSKAKTITVSAR